MTVACVPNAAAKPRLLIILAAAALVVGVAPLLFPSEYFLRVAAITLLWIGLAGCWNLMSGYTGYIDFGPVVYFGIGAYTTAILMTRVGLPFFPALALSGLIAACIAAPVGAPTLRLRGSYFAIATFAFAETMRQTVLEFDRAFGVTLFDGSFGISLPPSGHTNLFFYYCLFGVSLAVIATHYYVDHSKFGYGLKAIHESESAAEAVGVNTHITKLTAYCLSAFFLGLFGGIEAYWITYITPTDAFSVHKTVQMVIMTLLGGMGTMLGPVVGACFLTLIAEFLGAAFVEYYLILIGLVIIVVIQVAPQGLIGFLKQRYGWKSL